MATEKVTLTLPASKMTSIVDAIEKSLAAALDALSASNISQSELLRIQTQIQQWNTAVSLLATLNKSISDTLQGIIQKM